MSGHLAELAALVGGVTVGEDVVALARVSDDCSAEPARFRQFELYRRSRLLLHQGRPIEIGSRAFDLLSVLLAFRGQVVEKDEIMKLVWPTTTVDESNLRFQVATLRRCLGYARELVRTIPGRGYMFAEDAPFPPLRVVSQNLPFAPQRVADLEAMASGGGGLTQNARLQSLEAENVTLRRLLLTFVSQASHGVPVEPEAKLNQAIATGFACSAASGT